MPDTSPKTAAAQFIDASRPEDTSNVMLCMNFMIGAALLAPLAALMAVLELTSSPVTVTLVIIIANMTTD